MSEPNKHSRLLISEHFTTAKLVTTTSPTPNGSRSAAANDVSSRVFLLPSPSLPVTSPVVLPVSLHLASHSLHGPLCSSEIHIFMTGPCLTSTPSITLQPSVTCVINMDFPIFDCHLSLPKSRFLHTNRQVALGCALKISSPFSSRGF